MLLFFPQFTQHKSLIHACIFQDPEFIKPRISLYISSTRGSCNEKLLDEVSYIIYCAITVGVLLIKNALYCVHFWK